MKRIALALAILGLVVGVATQAVAFPNSMSTQLALGKTLTYALGRYFGFLTILANIWLVLIYFAELSGERRLSFFRKPDVQTSALATIILVMLFQHFILNPTRPPLIGLDIYTDFANHVAAPTIYLLWWLFHLPHAELKWRHLLPIMLPAVLYPGYVLARGPIIHEYPYSVLDVTTHGYPFVLSYMVEVIVGFAILCIIALGINSLATTVSNRRN